LLFVEPFFLLIFLPLALVAFYGTARVFGPETALAILFTASCVFYAQWGLGYFALMMFGTIVNFAITSALVANKNISDAQRGWLLAVGQLYNFGTLVYFKYLPYLVFLATGASGAAMPNIAIPIGISFYTFQQAVLLSDAYARNGSVVRYLGCASPGRALLRYGAFHCFFPQLVIGPITYMSEFAPQILSKSFGKLKLSNFEVGATLLVIGLFKKVVIADNLGRMVDPAFAAMQGGSTLIAPQAWAAALAYYPQLYFDFSGYADMALGIGRLFGLRLPINFDSPLRASGIVDFYRRWHITLTRVIARFLFTPLSLWGTRIAVRRAATDGPRKFLSSWLPLWINFEAIALWHGAMPTFLLFGLIHGTWFIVETEVKATRGWRNYKKFMPEPRRRVLGQILTFLPLMLTFALFRSGSLSEYSQLIHGMLGDGNDNAFRMRVDTAAWLFVAAAYGVIWFLPNSVELLRHYRPGIRAWLTASATPAFTRFAWRPNLLWGITVVIFGATYLFYANRGSPFIYMGY